MIFMTRNPKMGPMFLGNSQLQKYTHLHIRVHIDIHRHTTLYKHNRFHPINKRPPLINIFPRSFFRRVCLADVQKRSFLNLLKTEKPCKSMKSLILTTIPYIVLFKILIKPIKNHKKLYKSMKSLIPYIILYKFLIKYLFQD